MGWPKGRPHSKEHNAKIGRGNKLAWKTRKRKWSMAARKRLSEAMVDLYKHHPHPMLGKKHSEATKKHWSKIRKGVKQPEDLVQRRNASVKKAWESPKLRKAASSRMKGWFSKGGKWHMMRGRACRQLYLDKPIQQEVMVQQQLKKLHVRFEPQVMIAGSMVVDIFLPKLNAVIECDGQFSPKRFARRDRRLLVHVTGVVHLSYKEICADPRLATERALKCLKA